MKLIARIRKLMCLVDMIDDVQIDKDTHQTTIVFGKDVLLSTKGNMVFESGMNTVIKVGSSEYRGLLFLNPAVETQSNSVQDIVKQSHRDYQQKSENQEAMKKRDD